MDIICHKIAENFVILLSSWPCLDGNILTNGIKVIIYAYAHMIIDYYDLKMIFEILKQFITWQLETDNNNQNTPTHFEKLES